MQKLFVCQNASKTECCKHERCSGYFWKLPNLLEHPCFKERKLPPNITTHHKPATENKT